MASAGSLLTRALLVLLLAAPSALAAEDFFEGRRMTYLVGTKIGGGYDRVARLVAPFLEKHLGLDRVTVVNIPGAGGLIALDRLRRARPDGLTIGTFNTGLLYAQLLGDRRLRFDLRELRYIGKATSSCRVLLVPTALGATDVAGLRALSDPLRMATHGAGSANHFEVSALRVLLGLDIQLIGGFSGRDAELALLRGDTSGLFGSETSFDPIRPQIDLATLLHAGRCPPGRERGPTLTELVDTPATRKVAELIEAVATIGKATAAPVGLSEDRAEALAAAYTAAMADPELHEQAAAAGLVLDPADARTLEKLVAGVLGQDEATRELLRQFDQR